MFIEHIHTHSFLLTFHAFFNEEGLLFGIYRVLQEEHILCFKNLLVYWLFVAFIKSDSLHVSIKVHQHYFDDYSSCVLFYFIT